MPLLTILKEITPSLQNPDSMLVYSPGGGGTRIIFWRSVRPEVWNTYPYLRIFLTQKNDWIDSFFEIFANRDPFLRVFLPEKRLILAFFRKFCEIGPSSKDFFDQSGTHV